MSRGTIVHIDAKQHRFHDRDSVVTPALIRCAVVPPAPAPYREPLFSALSAGERISLRVIYQASRPTSWDQPSAWFASERAYEALYLPAYERARPGRTPVIWPRGLERALSTLNPHVVVSSEFGPATLRALTWCRRHRRPLVILTEVTRDVQATLPAPQQALHRWLAARAQGFVAVSSRVRERLLDLGVPPDAIELSLQPADLGPIRAAAAARKRGSPVAATARVLTVGRLVPDKNFSRLLEAFAAAGAATHGAELHIHGVGPLQAELREVAGRLGVPATFHGFSSPAEMADAYASADLFALVSTFEPFGVAVREAVAAGLPLICSRRVGAVDDLAFDGRNALLVDPEDVGSMSQALARLCGDAQLRRRLGAASLQVDGEHDLEGDVAAFARAVMRAAGGD
jgi:glycosyltransferase involved in cell wall biosynthesis